MTTAWQLVVAPRSPGSSEAPCNGPAVPAPLRRPIYTTRLNWVVEKPSDVCSRETGSTGSTLRCCEPRCATGLGKLGPESQAPRARPQNLGPKNKAWASSLRGNGFGWGTKHLADLTVHVGPPPPAAHPIKQHLHILPFGAPSSGKAEAGLLRGSQQR